MSILTTAQEHMQLNPPNKLVKVSEVPLGKDGVNHLFRLVDPDLQLGWDYDFTFLINRKRSTDISFTEDGYGEFALFGKYKNTTRTISNGFFQYRKYQEDIKLTLRIGMTYAVDLDFLKEAQFDFIVKGLTTSEPLIYTGTVSRKSPKDPDKLAPDYD